MAYQRGSVKKVRRKEGETWVLRYEVIRPIDGKRVEQTKAIGLYRDFPSHDLARAEADRQCPNLEQPNFKGQATFRQIAEHFLKEECADKTRAASTLEDRNRILTKILIPRWGSRAALSIKAPEVKQWKRAYQAEQDIQDATMKKVLDIMGAVYRLAIVDETGRYIGEEYSLILAAKLILAKKTGVAVANLSSSRMLDDVAAANGGSVADLRYEVMFFLDAPDEQIDALEGAMSRAVSWMAWRTKRAPAWLENENQAPAVAAVATPMNLRRENLFFFNSDTSRSWRRK